MLSPLPAGSWRKCRDQSGLLGDLQTSPCSVGVVVEAVSVITIEGPATAHDALPGEDPNEW
jgi:hypothetical protein